MCVIDLKIKIGESGGQGKASRSLEKSQACASLDFELFRVG